MRFSQFDFDDEALDLDNPRPMRYPKEDRAALKRARRNALRAAMSGPGVQAGPAHAEALPLNAHLDATQEERAYLHEQLGPFYEANLITGVERRVKGGKEANVYCCAAHPSTGVPFIAAKVYRPRAFRNLRNDATYRLGRPVLTVNGEAVNPRDWRLQKAIAGKSAKGLATTQASWVAYEFQTLQRLHAAGVDVPRPYRNSEHALLMDYVGALGLAAPALHQIHLEADEAQPLFDRMIHNIETMLAQNVIHGDLSAYNVLYWEGALTLIDFPQIVHPQQHPEARAIFERDVTRICQYFARYGVRANPATLARALWR